jgi:hypothetical protein
MRFLAAEPPGAEKPPIFDNLKVIDELGGPKHYNHFPSAWAHAMDTPFQWTKQVASHFGGTRNPMIISWPARIRDRGGAPDEIVTQLKQCREQIGAGVVDLFFQTPGSQGPDARQRHVTASTGACARRGCNMEYGAGR